MLAGYSVLHCRRKHLANRKSYYVTSQSSHPRHQIRLVCPYQEHLSCAQWLVLVTAACPNSHLIIAPKLLHNLFPYPFALGYPRIHILSQTSCKKRSFASFQPWISQNKFSWPKWCTGRDRGTSTPLTIDFLAPLIVTHAARYARRCLWVPLFNHWLLWRQDFPENFCRITIMRR